MPKPASPRDQRNRAVIDNIVEVATREFAENGLNGARVDAIAQATQTSKRMLYYHFESKEGLYIAVLEEAYRRMREIEGRVQLDDVPAEDALRRLVAHTVDYQHSHPEFIRLVMNENMLCGA
jgi:AcrR family transcriptional regulator